MAFISGGWEMTITGMDNGGGVTTKTYQLTSLDATDAGQARDAILAAFQGVSDLTILSYRVYEVFVNDSANFPASGVQKENQALLVFDIAGSPLKKATHAIPAPKPAIFVSTIGANADIVDTSNLAVIEYRKLFQGVAGGGWAYISDGEVANTLLSGRRRHVRNSRG